jgi:hypothetical protein
LPGDGVTGPSGARARDLSGVDEVSPLNPFNASVDRFFFNCYNISLHDNQFLKAVIYIANPLTPEFKLHHLLRKRLFTFISGMTHK